MTLPASDNYITYGGELVDYSTVENPQTDLSAEASNALRASVAGLTATCFRAIVNFATDGYGDIHFIDMRAVWDVDTSDPVVLEKIEPGWYQVTFPDEVYDLRSQPQNINLLGGIANLNAVNTDNGYFCTVYRVDNVTFQVFLWSAQNASREDVIDSTVTLCVR